MLTNWTKHPTNINFSGLSFIIIPKNALVIREYRCCAESLKHNIDRFHFQRPGHPLQKPIDVGHSDPTLCIYRCYLFHYFTITRNPKSGKYLLNADIHLFSALDSFRYLLVGVSCPAPGKSDKPGFLAESLFKYCSGAKLRILYAIVLR